MKTSQSSGNIKKSMAMIVLALAIPATGLWAGDLDDDRFQWVFGPRVGFTYTFIDSSAFTDELAAFPNPLGAMRDSYFPFMTQFGISCEQRILLGTTKSHFAFQEIAAVAGIDQSLMIPVLAVLLGYRADFGLEFGIGPQWSPQGLAVCYAFGWTFTYSDVYVPVDVVFVPDLQNGHHSVSFFTGFNF